MTKKDLIKQKTQLKNELESYQAADSLELTPEQLQRMDIIPKEMQDYIKDLDLDDIGVS